MPPLCFNPTISNMKSYRIADYVFDLFAGKSLLTKNQSLENFLESCLLSGFAGAVTASTTSDKMPPRHSKGIFPALPYPLPMRNFRDYGVVIDQVLIGSYQLLIRAGQKNLVYIEELAPAKDEQEFIFRMKTLESTLILLAVSSKLKTPFLEGVCLQKDGQQTILLGNYKHPSVWIRLIEDFDYQLLANDFVFFDETEQTITSLPRAPRLGSENQAQFYRLRHEQVIKNNQAINIKEFRIVGESDSYRKNSLSKITSYFKNSCPNDIEHWIKSANIISSCPIAEQEKDQKFLGSPRNKE